MPAWARGGLPPDVFDQLATRTPGSELTSLLLEVMHTRAHARTPAEVRAQFERDRFVAPSQVDLRESLAIDTELLAAASAFEAIELSPVAPLATSAAMGHCDQHRVLSALRTTEVVSDPTNVLALVAARRLPHSSELVTSQRVVRAQAVPQRRGFSQHFRIFVLASAGIEQEAHAFTIDALVRHVRTMHAALDRLEQRGYAFGRRRVTILATPERAALGDRIAAAVDGERAPLDHAYYSGGLRYMLWVTTPDGEDIPLADGGAFDWLARLTSNRRAVYVASGLGAQLVALRFRAAPLLR